jgi:hypothetical protein
LKQEELKIVFDAVMEEIKEHQPKKGDTWRFCDMAYLVNKLNEELNELFTEPSPFYLDPTEIPDVILVLSMIYLRYKNCI